MTDHRDPDKLAWALHTSDTHAEAAEKLDCSVGSISVWKAKLSDELEQYDESDFTEQSHDPDEVSRQAIRERLLELLDADLSDGRITDSGLGVVIGSSVNEVAGTDLNPMVAISQHNYDQSWVERCEREDVGLIVVTHDDIEVVVDCDVTFGSGMRAIIDPENAGTVDKYQSRAWMKTQDKSVVEIAKECSLTPRSVRTVLSDLNLDTP